MQEPHQKTAVAQVRIDEPVSVQIRVKGHMVGAIHARKSDLVLCGTAVLLRMLFGATIAYEEGDCHAEKGAEMFDVFCCAGLLDNSIGKFV